ncbi:MAG: hypothetical protein HQ589_08500 [Syntrophaceae bacterium]|nr:hypothetical protein [Syntrophaceae bacterium]
MKQHSENEKSSQERIREVRYQLWGWILFMVCAVFFIAAGIKNRDVLTLVGSIVFLAACVVFLIPVVQKSKQKKDR